MFLQQVGGHHRAHAQAPVVGELQASRRGGHQGELLFTHFSFSTARYNKLFPFLCQRTRAGELHIAPKQSEADWFRWLENIQDWCISRQLWWGHRCPAYFVRIEGQEQDVSERFLSPLPSFTSPVVEFGWQVVGRGS